ncbi:4-diphosphocytidyl-2-C-methyl-D-erythritol kinase [Brevundimonas sp. NIBR10]|uniref:4-(cytidine 5'-diphospho)-2-C-methyl-D-erythritol kinase n=1 Tax=Brevundimonas sp. NIBR10 TaxID=3015997 RepID=UPI0022F16CE0|nr:4-(cytidine 5'-diphospho)-2-C-methyl-D-erythritol kinase [Brevundimonas sp. NIBR10]WGM48524.1 4-diphosphocytidyl-2-C-methyl-D-erythritol kinase [Brevundimonas sp. NIBR10]
MISALAPAKVNLCLHVGPVRADGYHPLASLVAFADVGDVVTVEPADRLSLTVNGPFGAGLDGEGDNLILRALRALGQATGSGEPPLKVTLDKRLPIAAGMGGGSSDAGAALRLARTALDLDIDDAALETVAAVIGADGPMCLRARTAWAEGIGGDLSDAVWMPPLHAVLVNPGVACSTGAVYRAYDVRPVGAPDRPADPADVSPTGVIRWLAAQRNDLEAPALTVAPAVAEALADLAACPWVGLVRMSGSGATVFALFDTARDADEATRALQARHAGWWVARTVLGDQRP